MIIDWKKIVPVFLWACLMLGGARVMAEDTATNVPPVIQKNFDDARRRYQASPDDAQAGWQLGRACFDRAEFSRDSAERARLANEGILACEKVIKSQPQLAEGHYYLAMNMAQLARTKLLGALPLLGRMQNEWLAALAIDETLDYGGPDRYVGLLYRDAPAWPVSLGNTHKAKQHLRHALKLAPNFPENDLNMIESCLSWHDTNGAARAAETLRQILPDARKEFTGDYWDVSWKDWNSRLEKIESALKTITSAPRALH